jgi:co-chaperonin GroES (HSP10)
MKCYNDFIVQVPKKYRDTIKTPSGVEIFVDSRWNLKDTVNTVLDIHELPMNYNGPIKKGDTVFVDATIFMEQIYQKGGKQENLYLIDRKTFSYRLKPNFIIAYKPKGSNDWIGHGQNVLVKRIKEQKDRIGSILLPKVDNETRVGKGVLVLCNSDTEQLGISKGDQIYFNNFTAIDVKLDNEWLTQLRNKDLMAVTLKDVA